MNRVVQTLKTPRARYEQSYKLCGKPTCWCATEEGRKREGVYGHGPYWWRIVHAGGRKIKKYIGKELKIHD